MLDFPDFVSFNSELHRITPQLKLCEKTISESELIEKTLPTFPPTKFILFQQYRNMKCKKDSRLMSRFLYAHKHQRLLLKNVEARPAWEVHSTTPYVSTPSQFLFLLELSAQAWCRFHLSTWPRYRCAWARRATHSNYLVLCYFLRGNVLHPKGMSTKAHHPWFRPSPSVDLWTDT